MLPNATQSAVAERKAVSYLKPQNQQEEGQLICDQSLSPLKSLLKILMLFSVHLLLERSNLLTYKVIMEVVLIELVAKSMTE